MEINRIGNKNCWIKNGFQNWRFFNRGCLLILGDHLFFNCIFLGGGGGWLITGCWLIPTWHYSTDCLYDKIYGWFSTMVVHILNTTIKRTIILFQYILQIVCMTKQKTEQKRCSSWWTSGLGGPASYKPLI